MHKPIYDFDEEDSILLEKLKDDTGGILPDKISQVHTNLPSIEELIERAGQKNIHLSRRRDSKT